MKMNAELENIFKNEGFEAHILKENNDMFIEFSVYTPQNEEREEKLNIGNGTIHDVFEALTNYYDNFDCTNEYNLRKEEIGEEGYPQTSEELQEDISWYDNKIDKLLSNLCKYNNDKRSALVAKSEIIR